MIARRLTARLRRLLATFPAVVLLGARQVGKTTLAQALTADMDALYLDLEAVEDRARLTNAESYLAEHEQRLVVLDEIQRCPDLFQSLRGLIDRGRRRGRRCGRYLLLGSAAPALLRQSAETLAGRIAHLELSPLDVQEVGAEQTEVLWVRGGFPDSFLAASDADSIEWREHFIRTYLERDVPQLGPRISADNLRRFWTMLVHLQGSPVNMAALARNLGIDGKTVANYLDLMVDLLLVRRLSPWRRNVGKRLVKRPKVYLRDSGVAHALLNLTTREMLLGHPAIGGSWEGFVIENLLTMTDNRIEASFYQAAGAEIDLLLTFADREVWAIEIKRSMSPKAEKGFHTACRDVQATHKFIVYPGHEQFTVADDTRVISLAALANKISGITNSVD